MFFRARSATRLSDSRILVLNAGSQQFRIYDHRGKLVLAKGRRGRGPGEFSDLAPTRLTRLSHDTISIFDGGRQKLYTFTLSGAYVREQQMSERDAYDGWYYRRSWIDGPAQGNGRTTVRAAIDKLPPPEPAFGVRLIRVSQAGHLWVRSNAPGNGPIAWRVFDLAGKQIAAVSTPPRFEIHEIGRDYLLGVSRDEFDVEFVQLFRLEGAAGAPLQKIAGPDAPYTAALRPVTEETRKTIMPAVRDLMQRQEVFYSRPINQYVYAKDVHEFENWQPTKGFISHVVFGGSLGWLGLVVDRQNNLVCGVEVGGHFFYPQLSSNNSRDAVRIPFCE
jgi:hypothetical protein